MTLDTDAQAVRQFTEEETKRKANRRLGVQRVLLHVERSAAPKTSTRERRAVQQDVPNVVSGSTTERARLRSDTVLSFDEEQAGWS